MTSALAAGATRAATAAAVGAGAYAARAGEKAPRTGDCIPNVSPHGRGVSNTESGNDDTDPNPGDAALPPSLPSPHTGEKRDEHELSAVVERPSLPGVSVRRVVSSRPVQASSGGALERYPPPGVVPPAPPIPAPRSDGETAERRTEGAAAAGLAQGDRLLPPAVAEARPERWPLRDGSEAAESSRSSCEGGGQVRSGQVRSGGGGSEVVLEGSVGVVEIESSDARCAVTEEAQLLGSRAPQQRDEGLC